MTLNEAIVHVLREHEGLWHIEAVTEAINLRELYRRADGRPLTRSQVSARVVNMREVTRVGHGLLRLL